MTMESGVFNLTDLIDYQDGAVVSRQLAKTPGGSVICRYSCVCPIISSLVLVCLCAGIHMPISMCPPMCVSNCDGLSLFHIW